MQKDTIKLLTMGYSRDGSLISYSYFLIHLTFFFVVVKCIFPKSVTPEEEVEGKRKEGIGAEEGEAAAAR